MHSWECHNFVYLKYLLQCHIVHAIRHGLDSVDMFRVLDHWRSVEAKRVRSATDYENEASLREALTEPPYRDPTTLPPNEKSVGSCIFNGNLLDSFNCCDYQMGKLDLSTSHAPTLEDEVERLMELKHFAVLDSDHEEKFERITALASRIFVVPICLISLVDIGRQWFLSNR